MAVAYDSDSLDKISTALTIIQESCPKLFYTGHWNKGGWRRIDTGEELTWVTWSPGSIYNECATVESDEDIASGTFTKDNCQKKSCPVCVFQTWPSLMQLRGVSLEYNVDTFYHLINTSLMIGQSRTEISFFNNRWNMVNTNKQIVGWSESTTLPLGVTEWSMSGVSGDKTEMMNLHRSVEQPGHFCCDTGECISSGLVCDNKKHCADSSDEQRCQRVWLGEGYDKDMPPEMVKYDEFSPVYFQPEVMTSVNILDVMDVDQSTGIFSAFVKIEFEWFDYDLQFTYLKNSAHKNEINDTTLNTMWTPNYDIAYLETYDIVYQKVSVNRMAESRMSGDMDDLHPLELYDGADNNLQKTVFFFAKFRCAFSNIDKFPFGMDHCNFYIFLKDSQNILANLNLKTIVDDGPKSVSQFNLNNWSARETQFAEKENTISAIAVGVDLNLKFLSIFMVTYLPTILMNIINQATNYISARGDGKYEMVYTINITSMMVLASIYLSVSTSLPSTASIKPVELWLLFNLAYPFLVILVNIRIQVQI